MKTRAGWIVVAFVVLGAMAAVAHIATPNIGSPSTSASTSAASKSSASKSSTGLSSLPADAQGPLSAALGKDDSRYWFHPNAESFCGDNPRQALVAEFTREGAEVRSQNLHWRLETRAYGYGNALHALKAVTPQAQANRVEYLRDRVTEWYENGPLGLEQGFTLAHPAGKANGQPLTVELALHGNLLATREVGGSGLELRRKDGAAALRYTGLKARDATGRELRSWLEVRGERLLLRVEDGGARYPVVVDPWVQQAELTASDDKDGDNFGYSLAVDVTPSGNGTGLTLVVGNFAHPVGSNASQGAAYVFVENGGTWSQQAELTASDGAADDRFGLSVAVSSSNGVSNVVVGAPNHAVGSNSDQGAAYVFVESGGTWNQQAELTASDGAALDAFGFSVALSGGTAVVGSSHAVGSNSGQGAAYVFASGGNGTWSQLAELTASDGAANDEFGWSVALSGGVAVVGSPFHTVGSNPLQGAAYVFFFRSNGTWSQQAELTASDGAADDRLGWSVALLGSIGVVGAPDHPGGQGPGAVYVFGPGVNETYSQQAELTASDGMDGDEFGDSVAIAQSGEAVVGAPNHAVFYILDFYNLQGAAYLFVLGGNGTWSQQAELTASDAGLIAAGAAPNQFGTSVAVSGSTAVVGAPSHFNPGVGEGTAYVFVPAVAPQITSANAITFFAGGSTNSFSVTTTGYPAPALSETGALPTGVFFVDNGNGTGTLTGNPTVSGTFPITFTAANVAGNATQSFTLTAALFAPPSGNSCNGIYYGTLQGNLTVSPGQNCQFISGGVTGNVAQSGGNLVFSNASVGNNVTVQGGGTFSIGPSTTIRGNLQIQNIAAGSATNQICATNVSGDMNLQNNGTIVQIGSSSQSCPAGNMIGGNLQVQNNTAATAIDGNTVGGNLQVQNNTALTQVFNNTVTNGLQCQNNTSIAGGGNTAKQKQGQCSSF